MGSGTRGFFKSFTPRVSRKTNCYCTTTTHARGPFTWWSTGRRQSLLRCKPQFQSSVLGPILWTIYTDDLVRLLSTVAAYADVCTLSQSCCRLGSQHAVRQLKRRLRLVEQ